ncbi:MAG: hypothetical protein ACYDBB_09845 [Armatimonadota bacterium]
MNGYAADSVITMPLAWPLARRRYASRGQALIIAVLIMFVLVGLGGVFLAMIHDAMVQTAKAEERIKLDKVLDSGFQFIKTQLIYGPDGADTRGEAGPDLKNPGWINSGDGFYKVTVSYGPNTDIDASNPFLANPLDRYLKVDVVARYALENPPQMRDPNDPVFSKYRAGFLSSKRFLERKITAFMPIGLTDYLLWVTNLDGSADLPVIGTDLMETIRTIDFDPTSYLSGSTADVAALNDPTRAATATVSILPIYDGPIHVNGGAKLALASFHMTNGATGDGATYRDNFYIYRRDVFEATGPLERYETISGNVTSIMLNTHTVPMVTATAAQIILDPVNAQATGTTRALLHTRKNDPVIRTLRAPLIDQRDQTTGIYRYRALTMSSGEWQNSVSSAMTTSIVHTGAIGWGEGTYINNPDHIQFRGDIDALRQEWMSTTATNWVSGIYDPRREAVELTMHDYTTSASGVVVQLPYLELRRFDGLQFYDKGGQPAGDRITLPYPRNGVVYAEGNLIVRGTLPASQAFTRDPVNPAQYIPLVNSGVQRPGGWDDATGSIKHYVNDANRRYDLTIVSGGTIYIEGSLVSPALRSLNTATPFQYGNPQDSKLALLAMDNVCLNPTRQFSLDAPVEEGLSADEKYWRARAGNPIKLTFNLGGAITPTTRIMLRHAGKTALFNPLYNVMQMSLNGQPYLWNTDPSDTEGEKFYFCNNTQLGIFGIPPVRWSNAFYDPNWCIQSWGGLNAIPQPTIYGYGVENTAQFDWLEGTTDYLLSAGNDTLGPGFTVMGSDLRVDALIYAQRGSWFIIPGRYYNEDPLLAAQWPYPKYKEPLDIRIIVNGAIVQNRPAPPEMEAEWMKHWRGSNLNYFITGTKTDLDGTTVPDRWDPGTGSWDATAWCWSSYRTGIEYHYDATLMMPACYDLDPENPNIRYYRPRLPKLPVSPNVFSIGGVRAG